MESFSIGRILSRTFSLVIETLASVGVFVLILQIASAGVQFVFQGTMMGNIAGAQTSGDPNAVLAIFGSSWYLGMVVFSLVLGALGLGGAIAGLLKAANDEAVSVGDCFVAGAAKLLPVIGLLILWSLGVFVGLMLLIVPGVILITMWSVSLPALIGENLGVFASFGRSRELTRGSRLMIFLTLLIYLVLIYVVLFLIVGAVLGAVIGGSVMGIGGAMGMGGGMGMAMTVGPLALLFSVAIGWLFTSLLNALLVSLYVETVMVKEGKSTSRLGDVFS